MISAGQVKELSQNDLIQTGKRHVEFLKDTQIRLEPVSPNKLFSWNRQSQCVPHVVMVRGLLGIGKTTLMQKLVYDWANGEIYQRFAFVFFFKFRELHDLREISLEKLILEQYPHLESHIGDILQCPEELLFIFDGLDESIHQIDFGSRKLCTDPKQKDSFHVIVVSLVKQRLLMGCSILVTSRLIRWASYNIGVFQRMTEIMGFVHRHRLTYFEYFFGDKALSEKAFQYVQENATLYTLCYMPSYCWIVCTMLSMCFRAHPTNADQLMASSPKTMTQLFVSFVSNILANHSHEKSDGFIVQDLLSSVGRMAEYGVMNDIVMFDDYHLDTFRVRHDNPLFSCFLMKSGQPPHVNYTFLQLTLQDFFAALLHFINYDPKRLQESFHRAEVNKDGHCEIFLCFLCGLTDASTRSMLESHVGKLSDEASRQIISWLQKKTTKDPQCCRSFKDTRELLNIFYYLYEVRNKELVLQCIGSNRNIDLRYCTLTSADCSVLSFILESCRMTGYLTLRMCNIEDDALRKLVPALHIIRNLSFISSLTDSCCPHLASGIRDNQKMRRLYLFKSNLKDPHFNDLMAALTTSRIEELLLISNDLTAPDCTHLASGIRDNQTLRKLDLSKNNLKGPHFSDLMEALTTSRIEELLLSSNDLTAPDCIHLASGIRDNQTLRKLDLSGNNLKGPHFSDLMTALSTSRIEELHLINNNLTAPDCTHLASAIRDNQTLRKLDLSGNNLEGPHFSDLMVALSTSRIEELLLIGNDLTAPDCTHLASAIRGNQTLRKLDLSWNNLIGPNYSDLMAALSTSRIEELLLQHIELTDESAPLLVLLSNNTSLTLLDLRGNLLTDASAGYIQDLIVMSDSLETIRTEKNKFSSEAETFLKQIKPAKFEGNKISFEAETFIKRRNPAKFEGNKISFEAETFIKRRNPAKADRFTKIKGSMLLKSKHSPEKFKELKEKSGFKDMEKPHTLKSKLYTKTEYTVKTEPNANILPEGNGEQQVNGYQPLKENEASNGAVNGVPPLRQQGNGGNGGSMSQTMLTTAETGHMNKQVNGKPGNDNISSQLMITIGGTWFMKRAATVVPESSVSVSVGMRMKMCNLRLLMQAHVLFDICRLAIYDLNSVIKSKICPFLKLMWLERQTRSHCVCHRGGVKVQSGKVMSQKAPVISILQLLAGYSYWHAPVIGRLQLLASSSYWQAPVIGSLQLLAASWQPPVIGRLQLLPSSSYWHPPVIGSLLAASSYWHPPVIAILQLLPSSSYWHPPVIGRLQLLAASWCPPVIGILQLLAGLSYWQPLGILQLLAFSSYWRLQLLTAYWQPPVIGILQLLAGSSYWQAPVIGSLLAASSSSPSTKHFVDEHQLELTNGVHPIDPVLDELRAKELLTEEQCDVVRSKSTPQDKMRELYVFIRGWGKKDKDKLLCTLERTHKSLIKNIRRLDP
ncbi:NACHT, LRR and PYD domains-containing protein 3-like [Mantella aurantiaca]